MTVGDRLAHTHVDVEFAVHARGMALLVELEQDLPEAVVGNGEGVGVGPVRAGCEGDLKPGPCGSVDLNALVGMRGTIVDDLHAGEVHADM